MHWAVSRPERAAGTVNDNFIIRPGRTVAKSGLFDAEAYACLWDCAVWVGLSLAYILESSFAA